MKKSNKQSPSAMPIQQGDPRYVLPLGKEPFDIGSLPPSTLLDDHTASHYLGVTPGTLSVWRSTGRYALPFVKCGSKVRYRAADLLAFVAGRIHTHT
jgi:hypothetical protein